MTDGVIIRKWNDGAGCYEGLFQTYSIEACEIPEILLDMEVCSIGAYFDCELAASCMSEITGVTAGRR